MCGCFDKNVVTLAADDAVVVVDDALGDDSFKLMDLPVSVIGGMLMCVIASCMLMRQAEQRAQAEITIRDFKLDDAMCACDKYIRVQTRYCALSFTKISHN